MKRKEEALPDNNIIAIASGKGGVGKTWFSITLASLIARAGRKALLFDGDLGLANVDIQLGLTPDKDLGNVTSNGLSLQDVIMPYSGGFDIIAGRSGSGGLASLGLDKLSQLVAELKTLAAKYDAVILDLGAGVETHVRYLAAQAGRALVVVTDEPTSLTDAYAFIKICLAENPATRLEIVVNQAATMREGEQTYQTISRVCANFLKKTPGLAGIIRKDPKVKESIRAQTMLLTRSPNSTAATDAAAIAIKVMAS